MEKDKTVSFEIKVYECVFIELEKYSMRVVAFLTILEQSDLQ
jgi:hypothetical protein